MTRKEIVEWLSSSKDRTEPYTPLVQMVCVFEDETETTEVVFAVPINWLGQKLNMTWRQLQDWLRNEYTSDDSQQVLERAVEENQLAFWKIN